MVGWLLGGEGAEQAIRGKMLAKVGEGIGGGIPQLGGPSPGLVKITWKYPYKNL